MPPGAEKQARKDLLAQARETLERYCRRTRYAYLYPGGANDALLLSAYQELMRLQQVGRVRWQTERQQLRALKKILKRHVRADALARSRRLAYQFPIARPRTIVGEPPPVVERALADVAAEAPDAADEVRAYISGRQVRELTADVSIASRSRVVPRLQRGLDIFRRKLVDHALADPEDITRLHPQHIHFATAPLPLRRERPLARLFFIKVPLYFWMFLIILFNLGYLGAWVFFNDETLGRFMSDKISGLFDGEMEFDSVHWKPSLIVDLVTGQPAELHVKGYRIYEGYKRRGEEFRRTAVEAEDVKLNLVLHEIIPWNRLGIPRLLEIPWVLHFTKARSDKPVRIDVRQYRAVYPDGTESWDVGLVSAFVMLEEAPADQRGLSIKVEDTQFTDLQLNLDFREKSQWQVGLEFDSTDLALDFQAPDPENPPAEKPLAFSTRGHVPSGFVTIGSLGVNGYNLDLTDLQLDEFSAGNPVGPLGDIRVLGDGMISGSPAHIDGWLLDVFEDTFAVDLDIDFTDAGPIADTIVAAHELSPKTVQANGSVATLSFRGLLDDPTIGLSGQGLTLDFFDDPALDWSLTEADLQVKLHREQIPDTWVPSYTHGAAAWIAELEHLRGNALGGQVNLLPYELRNHIVVAAEHPLPMMMSLAAEVDGIDPSRLTGDRKLKQTLAGSASGTVTVPRMVITTGTQARLNRVELAYRELEYTRDKTPRDDGIPDQFSGQGSLVLDEDTGLDFADTTISTIGARVEVSGGLDAEFEHVKPTDLKLVIEDGRSFFAAYGLDPYFERLATRLNISGPIGSPNGTGGSLTVSAVGSGNYTLTGIEDARLSMDDGIVRLRSPKVNMIGGHGPLKAEFGLFSRGELASDPKLYVDLVLDEAELGQLLGDGIQSKAHVKLKVDDGHDHAVPLSKLQAHGFVDSPQLTIGASDFYDASARFEVTPEGLDIAALNLPFHRQVSPYHAPKTRVPVGEISGTGKLTFADDMGVALTLEASNVPISALTDMASLGDLPLGGQLRKGSRISVAGTISKPDVVGDIYLSSMHAIGMPLGRGRLELSSHERPAEEGLAPRHEVVISGDFRDPKAGKRKPGDPDNLAWSLKAKVAIGEKRRGRLPPISTEFTARFDHLPLTYPLHQSDLPWKEHVAGQLEGLEVSAQLCDSSAPLLHTCEWGDNKKSGFEVSPKLRIELDRMWLRARNSLSKGGVVRGDPCADPSALCSDNRLVATLDGSRISLADTWEVRSYSQNQTSGASQVHRLSIDGDFDFGEPPMPDEIPENIEEIVEPTCKPPDASRPQTTPQGNAKAKIQGELALSSLSSIAHVFGVKDIDGQVALNLDLLGVLGAPVVSGNIGRAEGATPLDLELTEDIHVELPELAMRLVDSTVFVAGNATVAGQNIGFGNLNNEPTFYTFAGPCNGTFAVSAQGDIKGTLIQQQVPSVFKSVSGSLDLGNLHIAGQYANELRLDDLRALVRPDEAEGFRAKLDISGLEEIELTRGEVEVIACDRSNSCRGVHNGYGVFVGGTEAVEARNAPRKALRAKIGNRGRATAWGYVALSPDFSAMKSSGLNLEFQNINYTMFDNSGRPELKATVSSEGVQLTGRDLVTLRGEVQVVNSKWIRDAQEQFKVLSFEDPNPAPESPTPDILNNLLFDLRLRTVTPVRVNNNVFKGVEGQALLDIGGTYNEMDFAGRIDVNTGVLDIALLGAQYDIQRGRVILERNIMDSTIDVLALRQEPIYIDAQPRQMYLQLGGSLNSIEWTCIVQGDSSGSLSSYECAQYLVLGEGSQEVAESDVRRYGGGGGLFGKPINLVGNLTKLDVDQYVKQSLPRLTPYTPELGLRLGQFGIQTEIETPTPWFESDWGSVRVGAGYTRGYPGLLLRQSANWRIRFELLDNASIEFRDSARSYYNERIIFDPLRQRKLELRFDGQVPSLR